MATDVFNSLRLNGKTLAEQTIKNKIEQFISSGIYHDLDEFISDNPDLSTFQTHTRLNNTLRKVWGYQITDQEYLDILDELKQELADRKKIDMDNVKTVNANGKEITTYESANGTMVLDNSYAKKSMEEQLPELQKEHEQFQTGGEENIDAMMNYMQEEIKPEVEFESTDKADSENLSDEEKKNVAVAKTYEEQSGQDVQVDVDNGLIMSDGEIQTIEKRDDGYEVYSTEEVGEKKEEEETKEKVADEKAKQKVLTLNTFKQAGFSNAFILAFIVGFCLGIVALSIIIP